MFYNKVTDKYMPCPEWWMIHGYGYYRRIRTTQEIRRFYFDRQFLKMEGPVFKIRHRRNGSLDSWNLEKVPSCFCSKSWKKLYKVRKQYLRDLKNLK